MPETFLILLAGGIMLAAGVSDPKQVTLQWLRLCGILALVIGALSIFFMYRRVEPLPRVAHVSSWMFIGAVLGQLAFAQMGSREIQRVFSPIAFLWAVRAGMTYLEPSEMTWWWTGFCIPLLSALGIAAMSGLTLMDMLLGHAYLTASKMTIAPFRRLNAILGGVLVWRAIMAIGAVMILQHYRPIYMLWGAFGLFILTRWLVGLAVPAVFIYMAHDCIKRRSTQSATGILYVAGVLIFIGELLALYLVRATGLPF